MICMLELLKYIDLHNLFSSFQHTDIAHILLYLSLRFHVFAAIVDTVVFLRSS